MALQLSEHLGVLHVSLVELQIRMLFAGDSYHIRAEIDTDSIRRIERGEQSPVTAAQIKNSQPLRNQETHIA
jgi:hypothetical protein